LGLAVLAKGLVPLVLAAPLAVFAYRRLRDTLLPALVFLIVAGPWYVLCTLRNGSAFIDDFFLKHHFARFSSEAIQHVQPFWFYFPVLLGALFPWTPALALIFRRKNWNEPARRLLVLWLAWGFLFFSAATNKLPGYLLPLLPAAAVLMALGLSESRRPHLYLAVSTALLCIAPLAVEVLPRALEMGLSRAAINPSALIYGIPVLAAAAFLTRMQWHRALLCAATIAVACYTYVKIAALPAIDEAVSARSLWQEIKPRRDAVCVEDIHRAWRYGLNYYSVEPLPDCANEPRPLHITQIPGQRPSASPR
jgi:4-amino-4-deoxy-L-arabinose transferase-like glycosyltransferase